MNNMDTNEQVKAQLLRRGQTLEEIRNLLEHIKYLINLIAELIEQQQDTGNNSTYSHDYKTQLLITQGNEESERN